VRLALIADVHANLPALEAVVAAAQAERLDGWLCAGDLVGYGPQPNETVAAVVALGGECVAGNHDLIATGRLGLDGCSDRARRSLEWTTAELTDPARAALLALPREVTTAAAHVVHGGIGDPERYVRDEADASEQIDKLRDAAPDARLLLLGHTHVPMAFGERRGAMPHGPGGIVTLDGSERLVVNPGSVGQARVGPPVARFAVLDLAAGTVAFRAVPYDVRAVRSALRRRRLPRDSHHPRPPLLDRVPRPLRKAGGVAVRAVRR
jgi:predicted phosphodiesterase